MIQPPTHIRRFQFLWTILIIYALTLLSSSDLLAIGNSGDVGLNTSVTNLTSILNNNLVPVILITGCLAGVVFSFMKSSPTPFIIAFITTVSFGFAKTWIGGTYTVVV